MSIKYPIIAVTGSSGAGTSTVKTAFEHIFRREKVDAETIEGDSYHRFNRIEMARKVDSYLQKGESFSHFGPSANHIDKLEELFVRYGYSGEGMKRHYVHNDIEAETYQTGVGKFTKWEPIRANSDLLFYEGLHGGVVMEDQKIDIARHVDLLIGVVPIVNLEWIQKIARDTNERQHQAHDVTETILRRMYDYVHYITPQFSKTDINFQRVPTVDTSNPFVARDIPTADESFVVIRFRDPEKFDIDFHHLLRMLQHSFMSRSNTIVVPGGKMVLALEIIIQPLIRRLIERKRKNG